MNMGVGAGITQIDALLLKLWLNYKEKNNSFIELKQILCKTLHNSNAI